jgi:hypothetical protein
VEDERGRMAHCSIDIMDGKKSGDPNGDDYCHLGYNTQVNIY